MNDERALEEIVAENAALLGEEPTIGVHRLRDGRVRIYDLAVGWRSDKRREYPDEATALWAAGVANARAHKVARLIRERGLTVRQAVHEAVYS